MTTNNNVGSSVFPQTVSQTHKAHRTFLRRRLLRRLLLLQDGALANETPCLFQKYRHPVQSLHRHLPSHLLRNETLSVLITGRGNVPVSPSIQRGAS